MTLNDFMKTAVSSDQILIEDGAGNELYRGYAGCLRFRDIDGGREVKRHGLSTEIFRKERKRTGMAEYVVPGESVPAGNTNEYGFSDLMIKICTKVVLEG